LPILSYSLQRFILFLLSCFQCLCSCKLYPLFHPSKTNVPANIDSPGKDVSQINIPTYTRIPSSARLPACSLRMLSPNIRSRTGATSRQIHRIGMTIPTPTSSNSTAYTDQSRQKTTGGMSHSSLPRRLERRETRSTLLVWVWKL
jgi:hypothetical protein